MSSSSEDAREERTLTGMERWLDSMCSIVGAAERMGESLTVTMSTAAIAAWVELLLTVQADASEDLMVWASGEDESTLNVAIFT
jgi:hypothetical protein